MTITEQYGGLFVIIVNIKRAKCVGRLKNMAEKATDVKKYLEIYFNDCEMDEGERCNFFLRYGSIVQKRSGIVGLPIMSVIERIALHSDADKSSYRDIQEEIVNEYIRFKNGKKCNFI